MHSILKSVSLYYDSFSAPQRSKHNVVKITDKMDFQTDLNAVKCFGYSVSSQWTELFCCLWQNERKKKSHIAHIT